MNEQELRSLVRAAVARQMGTAAPRDVDDDVCESPVRTSRQPIHLPMLSSHTLYTELVNVGDACVIEPAVKCDHCGYCKSHGH